MREAAGQRSIVHSLIQTVLSIVDLAISVALTGRLSARAGLRESHALLGPTSRSLFPDDTADLQREQRINLWK